MGNCVKVFMFNDLTAIFKNQQKADEYVTLMLMFHGLPMSNFSTKVDYVPNIGF